MGVENCPTNPFTIFELQNPSHDAPELYKIRWCPDLRALKLWKGSSGGSALVKQFMEH